VKTVGTALEPLIARRQGNAYQCNGKQGAQPTYGICLGSSFGHALARARKSFSFYLGRLGAAIAP